MVRRGWKLLTLAAVLILGCASCVARDGEPVELTPEPGESEAALVEAAQLTRAAAGESETAGRISAVQPEGGGAMALILTSEVFEHGEAIPQRFSCDGEDFSPPLSWTDAPEGTRSFALIMDDPDAPMGTWVHWVLYNLPSSTRELGEDFPLDAQLSSGARNGRNSWRRMGYGGPCPPGGSHRYFFHLYALDRVLSLAPGADKAQVMQAMHGHILAETELMGTYQR